MGSLSTQLPPCSSSATANPQWMLLAPYGGGIGEDCNIIGDTETIAAAVTSNGLPISVSLRREPSPSLSRICLRFMPGTANRQSAYSTVIAAHGGSVLVQITSTHGYTQGYLKPFAHDYFVYINAVVAADRHGRRPCIYMLPIYKSTERWPPLDINATGLLCHGEAEFVVAELKIVRSEVVEAAAAAAASPTAFELHLFRDGEWCVKRPRIIGDHQGKDLDLLADLGRWKPQTVVPLGDGLLCWIDQWHFYGELGVIFSDVLDECPVLRYVPYPAAAVNGGGHIFLCTNARGALKLVRLSRGRCSHCGCSQHATAVDTWTLNTDDMDWGLETEAMVDSADLWAIGTQLALDYARVHLVYPVAGMNGGGHHVAPEEGSTPSHLLKERLST